MVGLDGPLDQYVSFGGRLARLDQIAERKVVGVGTLLTNRGLNGSLLLLHDRRTRQR